MAKTSSIEKNNKRRKIVKRYMEKRKLLKSKIYDKKISLDERLNYILQLSKLPRDSALIRVRNRCELTGRPRGCYRKFNLSRNMLRELTGKGLIPGLVKSSW